MLQEAKESYIEEQQEFKFVTSDIVPLVNMCFHDSFGRVETAKRTIATRG
jgi:hypothetical protein